MCRDASQSMENKENFPILFPESEILAKLRNTLASRTVIYDRFLGYWKISKWCHNLKFERAVS